MSASRGALEGVNLGTKEVVDPDRWRTRQRSRGPDDSAGGPSQQEIHSHPLRARWTNRCWSVSNLSGRTVRLGSFVPRVHHSDPGRNVGHHELAKAHPISADFSGALADRTQ